MVHISFWFYVANVNELGGSVHTVEGNAEIFLVASKEIGLDVNTDKTKYIVMHRNQNAGRNHSMKFDNSSFERAEGFKYLRKPLTKQNSIKEEIKSRLKSGKACYLSVKIVCFPICYPKI
jgi:hypothetical protein